MSVNKLSSLPIVPSEPPSWTARLTGRWFFPLALVLLISSFIAYYLIFLSAWHRSNLGVGDLATWSREQTNQEALDKIQVLRAHAEQVAAIPAGDRVRLDIALPLGPTRPELLVGLDALMKDSGMVTPTFDVEKIATTITPEAKDGQSAENSAFNNQSQTLARSLRGSFRFTVASYDQLKSILETIQTNLRLIDIQSLSYDAKSQSAAVGFVTYFISK